MVGKGRGRDPCPSALICGVSLLAHQGELERGRISIRICVTCKHARAAPVQMLRHWTAESQTPIECSGPRADEYATRVNLEAQAPNLIS